MKEQSSNVINYGKIALLNLYRSTIYADFQTKHNV
jgi:hypothetical protein